MRWFDVRRFSAIGLCSALLAISTLWAPPAQASDAPAALSVARAHGSIRVDGALDDSGWQGVSSVDVWYETRPGDNARPPVASRARLAYDDTFLYVAFEFDDPDPEQIRAPLGDRDNVARNTDYGGIILDPSGRGRSAVLLLVNARGVQLDSVMDDTTGGEDAAPDLFWESAARITPRGWQLEVGIPFSSLSYSPAPSQIWRIVLFRNYPRDFRRQFFSAPFDRGRSCFVCQFPALTGLTGLPAGGGVVFAPYASASLDAAPAGELGSRFERQKPKVDVGFDAKWRPSAGTVIDVTVNPDFSQIESDVAQIGQNERFALFYPEKRPFFLEGVDLLGAASSDVSNVSSARTPLQPVYTRTLTNPDWGVRGTGKAGPFAYTSVVVGDRGGGQVILPGPRSSSTAPQDFRSWAGIWRLRYELGPSFVGMLGTAREIQGGGYNLLAGPDFQWRASDASSVGGRLLLSATRTPDRPELATEWDGRALSGSAAEVRLEHAAQLLDGMAVLRDVAPGFRAYDGFIPRVGYREAYAEGGLTLRPEAGLFRQVRLMAVLNHTAERDRQADVLFQQLALGVELEGSWSSLVNIRYAFDRIRVDDAVLPQHQISYDISVSPPAALARVDQYGSFGQQIDFDNARLGLGADLGISLLLQLTPHWETVFDGGLRALYVDEAGRPLAWLFTAQVERLRTTYTVSPRFFVRGIIQHEATRRAVEEYLAEVPRKEARWSGSLLVAYKLNWQSVVFLGYGDERAFLPASGAFERAAQQFFVKAAYAFQR